MAILARFIVADFQHFGKAAEACFVSQPGLSMQIKKLEESLGVQLIERTNKTVYFTEIGQKITQYAREILNNVEAMQDIAQLAKDPFAAELHLGIIPTLAPYLLPHIVQNISTSFPKLTLYFIEETTENLLLKLTQRKLDAALLALPLAEKGDLIVEHLFEEAFMLATSPQHPFAKQSKVHLSDLKKTTLLLLEDGHCLRDQALAFCNLAQAQASKNFEATSLETLRYMVAANVGITLMPKLACRPNDGVCYMPFVDVKPSRTIGLIWRASTVKTVLLKQIAVHIRDSMDLVISI